MVRRSRTTAVFGVVALAGAAAFGQPGLGTDAQRTEGQAVYQQWCSQCHGDTGDGRGIATPFLKPWPRDFTSCKYQIRSTPTGGLPTDDDIRRVIEIGVPGTAMPAFPDLSPSEMTGLVYYLKSLCDDFADPEAYDDPLPEPVDPGFDPANVEAVQGLYEEIGCAGCHGASGRGDGRSAPTLVDDWGQHVRAADLTRPWTFNGGATRVDIFRSLSTGLNGTPMAGFESALSAEQLWQLVDFITSISDGHEVAPFANTVAAIHVDGELDLSAGEELFATATPTLFPLVGQVIEPGRAFFPAVNAIEVRAVVSDDEIAVQLAWHDFVADTGGANGPDLLVPIEDEVEPLPPREGDAAPAGGDPFADEEADPFADEVAVDPFADEVADDPFADEVAEVDPFADEVADDPFADEMADDPFAESAAAPPPTASGYSDAVAVQFPRALPEGIRLPYFLFGDMQNPVELWYRDLAASNAGPVVWEGRGSENLQVADDAPPDSTAEFRDGRWVVTFKRPRSGAGGVGFPNDSFVPVAFSVWDGFAEERGSKRALSTWYYLYVPPAERPSPVGPMMKAAAAILAFELLIIGFVRFRARQTVDAPAS